MIIIIYYYLWIEIILIYYSFRLARIYSTYMIPNSNTLATKVVSTKVLLQ